MRAACFAAALTAAWSAAGCQAGSHGPLDDANPNLSFPDARSCSPTDDSDGDGRSDLVEGCAEDRDTDRDGLLDYLDLDSDNDRIDDAHEDVDGDGVVDPGESDPTDLDTDDDSIDDGTEWMAGTDRQDPSDYPDITSGFINLTPADPEFVWSFGFILESTPGPSDVHLEVVGDDGMFVRWIDPPGVVAGVPFGAGVNFNVGLQNTSVPQTDEGQPFPLLFQLIDQLDAVVGSAWLYVFVPPAS